jgi:hypothetical protein
LKEIYFQAKDADDRLKKFYLRLRDAEDRLWQFFHSARSTDDWLWQFFRSATSTDDWLGQIFDREKGFSPFSVPSSGRNWPYHLPRMLIRLAPCPADFSDPAA